MFFTSAKCPVDDQEKRWIEESMLWLTEQFGVQTLCESKVILPTGEYFPDPYKATRHGVQKVLDRVCQYMCVNSYQLQLEIYAERGDLLPDSSPLYYGKVRSRKGTAGVYAVPKGQSGKTIIGVEASKLNDPPSVVATVAHEVGHFLLSDKKLPGNEESHEYLTDLVPIFFGLGILMANAAFKFSQWQGLGKHGWQVSRQGYLSEPMYGYALASFAWMRDEPKPEWMKYLELNIRTCMKQSLKYLHESNDTILPVYSKSSRALSDEARRHYERASTYEEQNEFARALQECNTVIRTTPNYADAHNLRGIILESLERKEEALSAYREAVRLDPTFREAAENLQDLEAELKRGTAD